MALKTDVIWLSGMFNGDGCISLTLLDWRTRFNCRVQVALTQTDLEILDHAANIIERIIGKAPYRTINKGHGSGTRDISHLRVSRMVHIEKLLHEITPHLVGGKRRKAEIMLKYIQRRKTFTHLNSNDLKRNIRNDEVSLRLVSEFYILNNGRVPKKISEALNDYLEREYTQAGGSAEHATA